MKIETAQFVGITAALQEHGATQVVIQGDSMLPHFRCGEKVQITKMEGALVPGRCYAFYSTGKLMLHRFVKCDTDGRALFIGDHSGRLDRVAVGDVFGMIHTNSTSLVDRVGRYINLGYLLVCRHTAGDHRTAGRLRRFAHFLLGRFSSNEKALHKA